MRAVRTAVGALTTAILLWPGLHAAAEPSAAPEAASPTAAMPTGVATPEADNKDTTVAAIPQATVEASAHTPPQARAGTVLAGFGKAVGTDTLADIRGGAEVVVNDMRLAGVVADNTANRVITGSNAISEGAFANASGLPTVIQNTGANTLIQNATILNVRFGP
ncbi:hypothetical protein EM868_01980 [Cupriavidus gilardii]|uniref:hypothetical protein n=1 Tax=Cupriavidus gilardii TaxID=82541 RepID=UPI001573E182|nr:hypothetical protein [Cupriavidus gilardii]MCG5261301.1 hypothetical protein [Cupriavidus gilardii]MDF9428571.1 hypothetical protein [Cupriavidus gilardii]NSX04011.1 hypothetical protein [Cupriavidus gilardii]